MAKKDGEKRLAATGPIDKTAARRACEWTGLRWSMVFSFINIASFTAFLALFWLDATPAEAAGCGGNEATLRERALESSDIDLSARYLSCFPYGDGVISVRAHHQKLQENRACEKALASSEPDELRAFVRNWSGSGCASRVVERLAGLQSLSEFRQYPNSVFSGTLLRSVEIKDMQACGLACKSEGQSCAGYSFETRRKVCALWMQITGRIPRGDTVSGSRTNVGLGVTPVQPEPPPPPPPAGGSMRYLENVDLPGNDYLELRDMTLQQCNAMCIDRGECSGFTYNTFASVCFLKSGIGNPIAFAGAISGFKPNAHQQPLQVSSMRLMQNVDLPNSDPSSDYAMLRQVTLNICQARCEEDSQCVAFTYNHSRNACILKSQVNRRIQFFGATSGIK